MNKWITIDVSSDSSLYSQTLGNTATDTCISAHLVLKCFSFCTVFYRMLLKLPSKHKVRLLFKLYPTLLPYRYHYIISSCSLDLKFLNYCWCLSFLWTASQSQIPPIFVPFINVQSDHLIRSPSTETKTLHNSFIAHLLLTITIYWAHTMYWTLY